MTTVISVRFRSGSKTYYFDPGALTVSAGDDVVVETAQGPEFAQCVEGNHEVSDDAVVKPLRPVLRIATDNDRHTAAYNRSREKDAFDICQKKIVQHGLDMKLVRVECSFDGSKILFFFTADGRVDFRELVKDLAGVFRSRIELRQIGVRDEAKMLGGLGICGRPFCCASYMDEFVPVSIKMAKTQNLSLNPTKISGTCGRLMCCLKYEQDAYEDAIKRMPKNDSFVVTPDGPGNVSDINVLKETVNVRLDERPDTPRCYHNCEVCVLRNGKGSRDGITVPKERPERYVEPVAAEEMLIPTLFSDFTADAADTAPEEDAPARSSRRRSRGGRRRGKSGESAAPAAETAQPAPKQEKQRPARPARGEKADKSAPEAAEGKEPRREGEGGQRRRRNRGGRGRGNGGESAARQAEPVSKPTPPAAPAPQEGEGGQRRRRSRGGRRRSRSGGGTPPASEA
mgnify:FL=1